MRGARRSLQLASDYFPALARDLNDLARTDVTLDEARRLIEELWPINDAPSARQVKSHNGRVEAVMAVFGENAEQLGRTAYALERGITQYLDWGRNIRPGRTMRSPRMSCSPRSLRMSCGYSPLSSISAARGRMLPSTMSRIVSRKSRISCGIS